MWIALWSVLAVTAIAVPVLLGLGLWQRVKAVGHEAAAFSDALAPLLDRMEGDPPRAACPTLLDTGTADRARELRRENRARRTTRREERLADAVSRWTRHGLLG